ncbi:iron reductase [Mycolicibacterium sp. 018/SC-01/001]|uniref:iron reductase n=1 Tax=Mycolicibacterium sp. 018/SC-01/001 TaxID=2592069 RepID=UPI00117C4830|nr:iron reductase [Mycolicibacterium sp. 018/SC-01/001]TRW82485.1 iron reductase [Mycolicibacterium sp. 018/SC-01/001]
MSVLVDDPLITSMTIRRPLPIHASSARLRELDPDTPRVHGVAVMGDLSRRRWWPLVELLTTDRLPRMYAAGLAEMGSSATVTAQLAATFAHVVVGRVIPLLVLEGRAWDTGPENLWVHVDSEGAIDWVGVVDPTLRALPDDVAFTGRADGIVALPSEAALTTWVAHRSHRALGPLFTRLAAVGDGSTPVAAMWHAVGAAAVSAATQIPLLAGSSEAVSMRRTQAVLDALMSFGLPVRGTSRTHGTKHLLN